MVAGGEENLLNAPMSVVERMILSYWKGMQNKALDRLGVTYGLHCVCNLVRALDQLPQQRRLPV